MFQSLPEAHSDRRAIILAPLRFERASSFDHLSGPLTHDVMPSKYLTYCELRVYPICATLILDSGGKNE